MTTIPLGPGSEFDAIRRLLDRWGDLARGVGDDAAVLMVPRGDALVASVDSAIEGQHFRAEWLSPTEIGYRAVAAALSDLAAMAASPRGVLVALGVPAVWRDRLDEIADGIGEAVNGSGTRVLGGNLSAAGELSITTTVLGSVFVPLMRRGAKPGDKVYVTGQLGGAAAALAEFSAGRSAGPFRHRLAHPIPRIAEARWLADAGATAAIDISDGLAADARHLATASAIALSLESARLPLVDGVEASLAVLSGEEYELLVTAPHALDTREFEARFRLPLTEIGNAVAGAAGNVTIVGMPDIQIAGYDHFSG